MIKFILILLYGVRLVSNVIVPGLFEYPVVQQGGNPYYVSNKEDVITQFGIVKAYGLLAHNYLVGEEFFDIEIGQSVILEFTDGTSEEFKVTKIEDFQWLSVWEYKRLSNGEILSDLEIYDETYNRKGDVVFQTCIKKNGIKSWGLRFIIAVPLIERKYEYE